MATFNYINDYCYIGKEEIVGKDIDSAGRHSNPIARITDYRDRAYNPAPNIGTLFIDVEYYYHEATTREDFPYFQLFIYDEEDKLVSNSESGYSDTYYYPDEHSGFLQCKIDLKDLQGAQKTIKYRCVLKCFLEVSKYRGCPKSQREITTSDSKETWLTVNITPAREAGKEPEVNCNIISSYSGKGWPSTNYVNSDWGEPYKFWIGVQNHSNNRIDSETLTLYENGAEIVKQTLGDDIPSAKGKMIVNGSGDWSITPSWQWYKFEGDKLKVTKSSETVRYRLSAYLEDDQGWSYNINVPNSHKLTIYIKVPEFKLNALDTYNNIITAQKAGNVASLAALLASLGCGAYAAAAEATTVIIVGALLGGGGAAAGGMSLNDLANQKKREFKEYVDDPPKIDINYKKSVIIKYPKLIFKKTRNKTQNLVNEISRVDNNFVINLKVLRTSINRAYTAVIKADKRATVLQKKSVCIGIKKVKEDINELKRYYAKLSNKLKKLNIQIKPVDVLSSRRRVIKSGLSKQVVDFLRKLGLSNKDITSLLKSLMTCDEKNIDPAKAYQDLAISLDKFEKSLPDLKKRIEFYEKVM